LKKAVKIIIMDKETFIFILKIIAAVVTIILFFTAVLPKLKQLDKSFTDGVREFFSMLFKTTVYIEKKSHGEGLSYSEAEYAMAVETFNKRVLLVRDEKKLSRLIKNGESLLLSQPRDASIRSKVALLYYLNGQFQEAKENYKLVTDAIPEWKRTFRRLKDNPEYSTIKDVFLELAALSYDMKNIEGMLDYYKEYLRISNPDKEFKEIVAGGIDQRQARLVVFSNLTGSGMLGYKKAIAELEDYLNDYPDDKKAIADIAVAYYEFINLFLDNPPDDFSVYVDKAEHYLSLALDDADVYQKTVVNRNLGQLGRIKEKLLSQ